jgi:SWIM zinc finger
MVIGEAMASLNQIYEEMRAKLPDELHSRLERAMGILHGDQGYELIPFDGCWFVSHRRDGVETAYMIDEEEKVCTCPDFAKVRHGLCKHRLAVIMAVKYRQENGK